MNCAPSRSFVSRLVLGLAVAALLPACFVEPLSLDGLGCNEEHPCADGYTCSAGTCVQGTPQQQCDRSQLGNACSVGTGECSREGTLVCSGTAVQCSATAGAGSAELCDGKDNDCDGQVDDGLTPPACALTQGVCAGAHPSCGGDSGWSACDYGAKYEATETLCDGLDNDCNGQVDEMPSCTAIMTLAGNGPPGFRDGPATDARFAQTKHLAADAAGNIYVADYYNHAIRKVAADGSVTTLAGDGACGLKDGAAATAQLCYPWGIAVAPDGKVYFSDAGNHRIRVISGGTVATVAGSGSGLVDGDGVTTAKFKQPAGLELEANGELLIADRGNAKIRRWVPGTGMVDTLAGSTEGFSDGTRATVQLKFPVDVAMASTGDLYVSEQGHRIRLLPVSGTSSTVAGSTTGTGLTGSISETAAGTAVRFSSPEQLVLDEAAGMIYVADSVNQRIRKVPLDTAQPTVSVLGSGSTSVGLKNGTGTDVRGFSITGFVKTGNVFIFADGNGLIRKGTDVTGSYAASTVTDFSGGTAATVAQPTLAIADGDGAQARLRRPQGITRDAAGVLYWVERESATVRKLDPAGVVTTLAGTAGGGFVNGSFTAAKFDNLRDVKIGPDGKLYTVESNNHVVRVLDLAGQSVAVLSGPDAVLPGYADSSTDRTQVRFRGPRALAFGAGATANTLYVADTDNCVIRTVNIADGTTTTLAGQQHVGPAGCVSPVDGNRATAEFKTITGIAVDASGTVYVADQLTTSSTWIRKVNADGSVQTLYNTVPFGVNLLDFDGQRLVATGDQSLYTFTVSAPYIAYDYFVAATAGFRDGPASSAGAQEIYGITHSSTDYYLTDESNHRVRRLRRQP